MRNRKIVKNFDTDRLINQINAQRVGRDLIVRLRQFKLKCFLGRFCFSEDTITVKGRSDRDDGQ